MTEPLYIWIHNWRKFQHYKPDPHRGPAWIKTYTAQLWDDRYLSLNDHQRCVLHDLRMCFANMRGKVPKDTRKLSGILGVRVTEPTLRVLNHAGFIEVVSRETLEQRLDELYSGSRAEVEKEVEKEPVPVPVPEANYAEGDIPFERNGTGTGTGFSIPEDLLREMPT